MNTLTYRTIIEKDGKYYHGYVPASLVATHKEKPLRKRKI